MRENILNMPTHLRRQRIVTCEQVAMAMAGVYHCSSLSEFDMVYDPEKYNEICSFLNIILNALGEELIPKGVWKNRGGNIINAQLYAADVWPWALNELSEPGAWFGYIEDSSSKADSSESAKWGDFLGKDTALKLIAGMAIALEKKGGKFTRGNRLNKSEVARTASHMIMEYGEGIPVTEKALIMLIDDALKEHASKKES
ncbi:hypothetical protein [Enterobacter quasiroggenkampii]|uniref:hypothetical protein n=1 Tax=Enterobacter quasiroggenkampii TaxID=2497436 RepID=UPI0021CE9D71|nr:hypothetical protein [Enterobacter quasiroggenkampii]MCU6369347.1 hypothetical protein [Enterobacter quasiroggenkampii]